MRQTSLDTSCCRAAHGSLRTKRLPKGAVPDRTYSKSGGERPLCCRDCRYLHERCQDMSQLHHRLAALIPAQSDARQPPQSCSACPPVASRCATSSPAVAQTPRISHRDQLRCTAATIDRASETSVEAGAQPAACLLCAPIVARSWEGARADIREATDAGADVVELRLDFLQDLDLQHPANQLQDAVSFARGLGLETILTLRPKWEG